MAPSDKNNSDSASPKKSSNFFPATIIFLVFATIGGILFYFNSGSEPSFIEKLLPDPGKESDPALLYKSTEQETESPPSPSPNTLFDTIETQSIETSEQGPQLSTIEESEVQEGGIDSQDATETKTVGGDTPATSSLQRSEEDLSQCEKSAATIHRFYQRLDRQDHIQSFRLPTSSEEHFTTLIQKLLANPPQVTRETDDLYTILKNTAHFFRISGKDNILMLKGILDSERGRLEELLADYYFLVTSPDCNNTPYGRNIDQDSLYEYGCFFLNTMGGRLYLFRRDSLSRMVVTYYAILLINQANEQNNNRHGLNLQPAINMLIVEMEGGGASLKKQEQYLDKLYELKEKYQ